MRQRWIDRTIYKGRRDGREIDKVETTAACPCCRRQRRRDNRGAGRNVQAGRGALPERCPADAVAGAVALALHRAVGGSAPGLAAVAWSLPERALTGNRALA